MENMKTEKELEELRQKFKQEFLARISNRPPESPDLQTVLKDLQEKTNAVDTGALPTNLDRVDQMKYAYVLAAKNATGFNIKVQLCENAPFPGMGYVQIEGSIVEFTNTDLFTRIAAFSDSMEIYAKSNGTVRITFTFHDLSHKKREGGLY